MITINNRISEKDSKELYAINKKIYKTEKSLIFSKEKNKNENKFIENENKFIEILKMYQDNFFYPEQIDNDIINKKKNKKGGSAFTANDEYSLLEKYFEDDLDILVLDIKTCKSHFNYLYKILQGSIPDFNSQNLNKIRLFEIMMNNSNLFYENDILKIILSYHHENKTEKIYFDTFMEEANDDALKLKLLDYNI